MARDYASKRSNGHRRSTSKRQARRPGTPGWVWMILGVAIGVAGAAAYWVLQPPEQRPQVAAPEPAQPTEPENKGIEVPPEREARFSFYEMLPSYEVVIPREEIEGSKEAARRAEPDVRESSPRNTQTLAEKGDYIIQIGSYRSRGDAESQRAELALIGVEARVETVTINESETWYRVRVGPIADAPRVHSLMMRLEEHGMRDAMLVRVKK